MNNGRQVNACLPFDFYMKVYSNHETLFVGLRPPAICKIQKTATAININRGCFHI